MKKSCRGQTATEMLLIIAFVVLAAAMAIVMSSNTVASTAHSISNITIIPK